tara:strand:+ start:646 stop:816 length:171 start_codon:yes stop_codon:yes gene_type:complete
MKPSKLETLIFRKRELATKSFYWENQKRLWERALEKIRVETEELEKEINKLKAESE